jgi:hypothetical protein
VRRATKTNFAATLFFISCLLLATGCHTVAYRQRAQVIAELKATNPADTQKHPLVATPIIDVHTHTFNARDLPIRNIALGRRDVYPPWTWLVTDGAAELLASTIVDATPLEETGSSNNISIHPPGSLSNRASYKAVQKALDEPQPPAPSKEISNALPSDQSMALPGKTNVSLSIKERVTLKAIGKAVGHQPPKSTARAKKILAWIHPFLDDLTSSYTELIRQFQQENGTNVQFRISHMMDMGPTYGQKEDEAGLRDFENEEIPAIESLQHQESSHLTYFVAYNPFRDNAGTNEALRIVQQAITNHHAYGVKVYPAAGYRPFSNRIPHRPRSFLFFSSGQPGKQWDARYTKNGVRITNEELDDRLLSLLRWCASNQIPVFAHCAVGEMQAQGNYGEEMAGARWWRELLEKKGGQFPELNQLRLALGHAGGPDFWFGKPTKKSWGNDVLHLCTHYPNIYCEVGDLDDVFDDRKQAAFAKRMKELCNPAAPPGAYDFHDKIMYGSDWYMPIAGDRHDFLKRFQQVFLLNELRPYYKKFFLANALAYLNATERIVNPDFPVDPSVQSSLRHLLLDSDH